MATLQIVFNCLCLFVRDEQGETVHVVMPATKGGHHAHHDVFLRHPSFPEAKQERSMEGWALALGPKEDQPASAKVHTLLTPRATGEVLDLTAATVDESNPEGQKVSAALVTHSRRVAARVTLRAGEVKAVDSETEWAFDRRRVRMATRVLWEMEVNSVDAPLDWRSIGAGGTPPVPTLASLGAEEPLLEGPNLTPGNRKGYVLQVFHSTPGELQAPEVTKHFRIFYELVGHAPTPEQLPQSELEGPNVNCGGSTMAMK
jgi:hypothetical protein